MPSNVEIKARVHDVDKLVSIVKELSDSKDGTELNQEDTFFHSVNGRLKLRQIQGNPLAQLVYYDRPDTADVKLSNYIVLPIEQPNELKAALGAAMGIKGILRKRRILYMVGQTRVHIDYVFDLGNFMELEVVLNEGETAEYGQRIANDLMTKLGIKQSDLLSGAYMDMVIAGDRPLAAKESSEIVT